jgi:hypothetical protein
MKWCHVLTLLPLCTCVLFAESISQPSEFVTIEGFVSDYEGNRLGNVKVHSMRDEHIVSETDTNGYYKLKGLKEDSHSITVLERGSNSYSNKYALRGKEYVKVECPHNGVYTCDLKVHKTGSILIKLTEEPGARIPKSIRIDLMDRRYWNYYHSLVARVEARTARIDCLSPGIYDATITAEGGIKWLKEIEINSESVTTVDLLAGNPNSIKGTVMNVGGVPLKNVAITLQGNLAQATRNESFETDENGKFEISALAKGEIVLIFYYDAYLSTNVVVKVPLESPLSVHLVPGLNLSGTVKNADGTPAGNILVEATDQDWSSNVNVRDLTQVKNNGYCSFNAWADGNGKFCFKGIPAGKYELCAGYWLSPNVLSYGKEPGQYSMVGPVDAGVDDVIITLPSETAEIHKSILAICDKLARGRDKSARWLFDFRSEDSRYYKNNYERIKLLDYKDRKNVLYLDGVSGVPTSVKLETTLMELDLTKHNVGIVRLQSTTHPNVRCLGYKWRQGVAPHTNPQFGELTTHWLGKHAKLNAQQKEDGWKELLVEFPTKGETRGPAAKALLGCDFWTIELLIPKDERGETWVDSDVAITQKTSKTESR